MKKNIHYSLLLLLILPLFLRSQTNTFIKKIITNNDQAVQTAIEVPFEGYILITYEAISGISIASFNKIDYSGNILNSISIVDPNEYSWYSTITSITNNSNSTYTAIGASCNLTHQNNKLRVLSINKDLKILYKKKYNVPFIIYNSGICRDHFSDIIVSGFYKNAGANEEDIFMFRLNEEGDSLNYRHFQYPSVQATQSIMEKQDLSGYYMPLWGRFFNVFGHWYLSNIAELDYDFNILSEDTITNDIGWLNNIKKFNENQFLISGITWNPATNGDHDWMAIEKLDTNYHAKNYTRFLNIDTTTYCAWHRNMDFIDTNNIYFGGIVNLNYAKIPDWKSYLILANMDHELKLRWQYFYGFDKYYEISGVLATNDGGCLMYGTYCNYTSPQTNDRDIILIKVDANGMVTGNDKHEMVHSAILYPNPGNDYINIQSGPQITGAEFTLYDMQGRSLLASILSSTTTRLATSKLPAGTYPWHIVYKGKVIESGKWVKK